MLHPGIEMAKVEIISEKVLSHVLISHLGKQAWSGDVAPNVTELLRENWERAFWLSGW